MIQVIAREAEAGQSRQQIDFQTNLSDPISDAVVTVDSDFHIQHCNAAAERLFGCSAREAAGQPYCAVAGTQLTQAEREAILGGNAARIFHVDCACGAGG